VGDVIWDKKSKQWTEYFNPTVSNPQEILRIVQATVACIRLLPASRGEVDAEGRSLVL
jgi:hypothetical protein